jgi:hypothetical protein
MEGLRGFNGFANRRECYLGDLRVNEWTRPDIVQDLIHPRYIG